MMKSNCSKHGNEDVWLIGYIRRIGILFVLGLLAVSFVKASTIPVLITGPIADGVLFEYNYELQVANFTRLDPVATSGVTCFGVQCNPPGTFFTIYDINGLVSASTTATNWSVFLQMTGLTPSTICGACIDTSGFNATFFYSGPVVDGPVDISGFQIISTADGVMDGFFSSQSTINNAAVHSNGQTQQSVGAVEVPTAPTPNLLP